MNKIFGLIFFLILSFLPVLPAEAEMGSNAGFVPANIWYSQDSFGEGDKIKIYTVIFNPDKRELSGVVSFYDDTVLLGKKDFVIPTVGIKDVYIDWTVNLGPHKIFAKITDTKYLVSKGAYEPVVAKENTSEISSYTTYKKIIPDISDIKDKVEQVRENVKVPINSLQEKVLASTPNFVAKPIISSVNFLENWREGQNSVIETKKEKLKSEIEIVKKENDQAEVLKEENDIPSDTEENDKPKSIGKDFRSSTSTPFKYVELFFLKILSFITNTKVVFYGTLVIILAIFIRILWRKIFK